MYAYVLVGLSDATEREVLDEISSFKEVESANLLFGEWDIIVKVKADSPEQIANFVIEKIRSIESVQLTSTLIVAN